MGRHPKSAEIRGRFRRARASGASLREAAAAAGVSKTACHYWLKESGGVRPRQRSPRPAIRLSLAEREEISRGLARGERLTAIATRLGRSPSTISREVRRNSTPAGYRAVRADRMAEAPVVLGPASSRPTIACGATSKSGSELDGRRSRSRPGYAWTSPTTPPCACPTRRSTRPCSCRPKAVCQASSRFTYGRGGFAGVHSDASAADRGGSPICVRSRSARTRSTSGR